MHPISRRSLFAAGLVVVTGCKSTSTYLAASESIPTSTATDGTTPPQARDPLVSIAMVGDSITEGSSTALREAFIDLGIDDDDIVINSETSRRIENGNGQNGNTLSGARALQALLDDGVDPSAWVIALGTNDVGLFGTPQECAALIEEITTLLPPPVPLVWVNVYRSSDVRETRVFNEVLEGVLADRGGAIVADWYSIASDPDRDVLRSDNLHPNDEGRLVFADLVVQALQRL